VQDNTVNLVVLGPLQGVERVSFVRGSDPGEVGVGQRTADEVLQLEHTLGAEPLAGLSRNRPSKLIRYTGADPT
jgi:hypothetical protein